MGSISKECTKCNQSKPLDMFHRHKKGKFGRVAACKLCAATANKEYYQKDATRHKDRCYKARLERKYNITVNQMIAMAKLQGNRCVICKRKGSIQRGVSHSKKLVIDHNHKNGTVRGLLCHGCNSAIGHFGDNPSLMIPAMRYLMTDGRISEMVFHNEL